MAGKSLAKNFAFNTAYQVLKILTPLITTPYIARVLGAELVGEFSYTQSITQYFVIFGVLGMATYGVRTIATTTDREERSHVFWNVYASQLAVCALVIAAYVVYLASLKGEGLVLALAWSPWVLSSALDISWLFFGMEDFKLTAIRSMVIKVIEITCILLFVRSHGDLWIYCFLAASEFLFDQIVIWPFLKQYVDWRRPSWAETKAHFLPNLRLFVPVVAISIYGQMDNIILGQLSTKTETGFYQYSYKVAQFPLAAVTALGTVMLPHMSGAFASGDHELGLHYIRQSIWIMMGMSLACMWGICGIAETFVPVFLGEEFIPCIPTVRLLSVTIPLIAVTNVVGVQYLLPNFRDSQYTLSVCVGAVVNVAVSLALVPVLGALGSGFGTVSAEVAVLVVQCFCTRKELPFAAYAKEAVPFFVIGLVMSVLMISTDTFFAALLGRGVVCLLLQFLFGAAVFSGLSFAYFAFTKDELFEDLVMRRARTILRR